MDNTSKAGGLPAPVEQSAPGMEESMSISQYAADLVKQAEAAKAPVATEAVVEEAVSEAVEAEATDEKVESTEPVTDEGDKSEGNEQPDDQPKAESEEVLSQLTPRTLEKFQKRTNELTARAKTAEEKALALEVKVKELEAKAAEPPPPPPEPEVIAVPQGDPNDLTATAKSDADLDRLDKDARSVLTTYEDNEDAITRAIARDEDTVSIDGQDVPVAKLRTMKKLAERHIREHIPARRKFLKDRGDSVALAKKEFPGLFDSRTKEYQELQWVMKTYPALRAVPSVEYMVGFALEGMAARRKQAEAATAKAEVKTAANTPPKSAADSSETTSQPKPRAQATGDRAKLKAELDKAEKELDRTGSSEAYTKVLIIQDRLKKLK